MIQNARPAVLDGTPLLDIKPYIAAFDKVEQSTSGWLNATDEEFSNKKSDDRFKDIHPTPWIDTKSQQ